MSYLVWNQVHRISHDNSIYFQIDIRGAEDKAIDDLLSNLTPSNTEDSPRQAESLQPSVNIESVRHIKADLASQEISLDVNDDRETKSICVQEIKEEKFANEYLGHIDSGPASIDNSQTEVSNNDGNNTLNNDMETKSICVKKIQ